MIVSCLVRRESAHSSCRTRAPQRRRRCSTKFRSVPVVLKVDAPVRTVAEGLVLRAAAATQGKALTRGAFAPGVGVKIATLNLIGAVSCDTNARSIHVTWARLAVAVHDSVRPIRRAVRAPLVREPDPNMGAVTKRLPVRRAATTQRDAVPRFEPLSLRVCQVIDGDQIGPIARQLDAGSFLCHLATPSSLTFAASVRERQPSARWSCCLSLRSALVRAAFLRQEQSLTKDVADQPSLQSPLGVQPVAGTFQGCDASCKTRTMERLFSVPMLVRRIG